MSETIACRLTAPIPSAIATISVRGVSALSLVGKCLDKNVLHWNIGPVRFAQWPIQGSYEHIVVCRIDDQTVEIHSHGGIAVTNSILGDLRMQGCRIVDQAEWAMQNIRRLADPADRLKVFCSQALIQTSSDRAAGILLDQAAGALNECFRTLDRLLQSEQWMAASLMLRDVAKWNELGRHLMNPWKVVLAGPPNVGKSSLINAIAGQTLSIVHHEPGTTRDWIECLTQIDGWPCSLTDTAGLRATDELVEREGVLRATEQMQLADLVVVVVDASAGWTEQQAEILKLSKKMENRPRILIAWNKVDLIAHSDLCNMGLQYPIIRCSVQQDITPLLTGISTSLVPQMPAPGQTIVFDVTQQELLAEIQARLQTPVDPKSASELKLLSHQLQYGQWSTSSTSSTS